MRAWSRTLLAGAFVAAASLTTGCTPPVRFNQRQRLESPAMIFDRDALDAEMVGHVLAPREGAVGGFSPIGAGGCACF